VNSAPVDVAEYLMSTSVVERGGDVTLGLPALHFETLNQATVSWCRDWRAEIRMTDVNAPPSAPQVTVGAVDFVHVQVTEEAPHRPIADRLSLLGIRAARFGELFAAGRLEPGLDENMDFCDGMPIWSVLMILTAVVDDVLPESKLRAWSVAEIVDTMLPTTCGMVAVAATDAGGRHRRLVAVDRLDPDWSDVGLAGIPGHPGFLGGATMFAHLGQAHTALSVVNDQVLTIAIST
jgi:hypothetical protein